MAKIYYKLRQKVITNYGSSYFWKIQNYYKLSQILLHITAAFSVITNCGKFNYKLQAGITNYDAITNYVVTTPNSCFWSRNSVIWTCKDRLFLVTFRFELATCFIYLFVCLVFFCFFKVDNKLKSIVMYKNV